VTEITKRSKASERDAKDLIPVTKLGYRKNYKSEKLAT